MAQALILIDMQNDYFPDGTMELLDMNAATANAFRAPNLEYQLRSSGIDQLMIVGEMSPMCIDATTQTAFDLGFKCTVLQDSCATRNLVFKESTIKAELVHTSFMAVLSAPYAEVTKTANFLAGSA
jgi:nicotinamidase-related amidase